MKITLAEISGWERYFLLVVFLMLFVVLAFVSIQAFALISMASSFEDSKLAYESALSAYNSAVVQTFVEPFNKIIGALVVYAFGKLGVKATDNYIRLKLAGNNDVELNRISILG